MMKHIAKHNGKKCIVVFRKIPGDDHLALVVYGENIPSQIHDDIMKAVESKVGQQEHEFASALHRTVLTDGRNALAALHSEGYLKKVPTNQVIMTPTSTSTVRLDELNKLVDQINTGDDARAELAKNDAARGIVDPATKRAPVQAPVDGALSDIDIANDMIQQAEQMEAEANSLLAEAKRMIAEAKSMLPKTKKAPSKAATARATTAKKKATA
jgi:hypothetical protein